MNIIFYEKILHSFSKCTYPKIIKEFLKRSFICEYVTKLVINGELNNILLQSSKKYGYRFTNHRFVDCIAVSLRQL